MRVSFSASRPLIKTQKSIKIENLKACTIFSKYMEKSYLKIIEVKCKRKYRMEFLFHIDVKIINEKGNPKSEIFMESLERGKPSTELLSQFSMQYISL